MTAKELQEKLSHHYELDWEDNDRYEYLKDFEKEYEDYLEMISA